MFSQVTVCPWGWVSTSGTRSHLVGVGMFRSLLGWVCPGVMVDMSRGCDMDHSRWVPPPTYWHLEMASTCTVGKWLARILLECILVYLKLHVYAFHELMHVYHSKFYIRFSKPYWKSRSCEKNKPQKSVCSIISWQYFPYPCFRCR